MLYVCLCLVLLFVWYCCWFVVYMWKWGLVCIFLVWFSMYVSWWVLVGLGCVILDCQFVVIQIVELEVVVIGEGEYCQYYFVIGSDYVLLCIGQVCVVEDYQWFFVGMYWCVGYEVIFQMVVVEFGVGCVVVGEMLVEYFVVEVFVVGNVGDVEFDVVDVVFGIVSSGMVYGIVFGWEFSFNQCGIVVLNEMVIIGFI